ncbi:helix-turn-helix transcriptional regulator [Nitriliruptoraceae bacterium ZYF776]|nr:helix-turn-helix transcriptional regulator [Profundirhabdus halotolerans]
MRRRRRHAGVPSGAPSRNEARVDAETLPVRQPEVCCEVLTSTIDEDDAARVAAQFKLLADPVRLRLLSLIANAPDGEACACDLTAPLGRSQPTLSHHLAALTDAGLLHREKRGRWAYYRLRPERVAALRDALRL